MSLRCSMDRSYEGYDFLVSVPPKVPVIKDTSDLEVTTEIGPFLEQASADVSCEVFGGEEHQVS